MHLLYLIEAFILPLSFPLHAFKTKKKIHQNRFDKIDSCIIVNASTESLNYRFYTAREKEVVALKFSPKKLF